jgi:hypothetical protein
VHPTEIAFDLSTAQRALDALDGHAAFGVNYDPSHFGYQGVDYLGFLDRFADRIDHVHMKDVRWADEPQTAGVFGGHLPFGHEDRYLDFRSIGRGKIDFEEIIRRLHRIGRAGPLSIEWEDSGMDCEHGAEEACGRVRAYVPVRHEKVEVPVELRVEEKQAKCKREAAGTANMGRSGAVHEKPLSLVSEDSNHLSGKVSHEECGVPRTVHHAHVNAHPGAFP